MTDEGELSLPEALDPTVGLVSHVRSPILSTSQNRSKHTVKNILSTEFQE